MKIIKLITSANIYFSLNNKELLKEENYIFSAPEGRFLIVAFCEHINHSPKINSKVERFIKKNIGIVYVCDKIPQNPIIHKNIVYVEAGWRWFTHLLFHNPLVFKGYFWQGDEAKNVGLRFSEFLEYKIPEAKEDLDNKNNILVEIEGGVGDCLMATPSFKLLHQRGYNIYLLLIDKKNQFCFYNLDFIKKICFNKEEIDVSKFEKVQLLHFASLLNDYRFSLNQQNRTYAIANLLDIDNEELIEKKPIIKLTEEEIHRFDEYKQYPKKLFLGYSSNRTNTNMRNSKVQEIIDYFTNKGITVFISDIKEKNFTNCINLTGKLNLREFFSLINSVDAVLTVDSSPLHIAQAFNKKIFLLNNYFPKEWRVVDGSDNVTVYNSLASCFPCRSEQYLVIKDKHCNRGKNCFDYFSWDKIYKDILEYFN